LKAKDTDVLLACIKALSTKSNLHKNVIVSFHSHVSGLNNYPDNWHNNSKLSEQNQLKPRIQ
jgi:hypothetical protein